MNTSVTTAGLFPDWKQEINQRIAAHMNQKASSTAKSKVIEEERGAPGSRAARVAARVAERYARAPSYSEILANEARAAMRAAEAASRAAQQTQAAVQYVLDGLQAASMNAVAAQPEAAPVASTRAQAARERVLTDESQSFQSFAEAPKDFRGAHAAEPILANLIQFPRQMVATRRMRPRRAEGPLAVVEAEPQLSIFEVDPQSVSTQPVPTIEEAAAPAWMRAEESTVEFNVRSEQGIFEEPAPPAQQRSIRVAPLNRRLMALLVDASLSLAAFLVIEFLTISRAGHVPGLRAIEVATVLGVVAIGAAYQALFLVLATTTPGMRYAGIELSTFEGSFPSRIQRWRRLAALVLSIAPLGLGLVWAVFDDDHLMGHDRLSKTYLRRR